MPKTIAKPGAVAVQITIRPADLRRLDRYRALIGLSRPAALRAALLHFLANVEKPGDGQIPS